MIGFVAIFFASATCVLSASSVSASFTSSTEGTISVTVLIPDTPVVVDVVELPVSDTQPDVTDEPSSTLVEPPVSQPSPPPADPLAPPVVQPLVEVTPPALVPEPEPQPEPVLPPVVMPEPAPAISPESTPAPSEPVADLEESEPEVPIPLETPDSELDQDQAEEPTQPES